MCKQANATYAIDVDGETKVSQQKMGRRQIMNFKGRVQTTPEKFENVVLFLRLGLPCTLIRHENGTFRKPSKALQTEET